MVGIATQLIVFFIDALMHLLAFVTKKFWFINNLSRFNCQRPVIWSFLQVGKH